MTQDPSPLFARLFGRPGILLGVVHLLPLPGAPRAPGAAREAMRQASERALADARALEAGGLDGAIVENFGDAPFFGESVPAMTVAAMAAILEELRRAVRFPLGVNVLRNDARAALALAAACGLDFLRVNVHSGVMLTDQGILEGLAAQTLRERNALGAEVAIFADVLVKHATPLGGARETDLPQLAEDTYRRGLADALLVTGSGTGKATPLGEVAAVRKAVPEAPVLVASGVNDQTVRATLDVAQGAIVGTFLKRDGRVDQPVDPARVRRLVAAARPGEPARSGEAEAGDGSAEARSRSVRARAKTE